ncbi:2-polyprenyl-6-methoxyphenol hydroxylase-like FAD-dependent oxidoreductase [Stackebrandtia endophytica]|uniref:2-polyprenyl-6-methoxyphenol hydroxylase-like FAD-dependent oxidoreductase n=1 Tax=Stackebrandtia endophytica TaxID=1496996 RepID=A0A543ATL8_9ACTN|nr:FAD-dependent monooxygenase [Stackebrandtia endophytica]TQL75940.1 2-polyprenyl-6-methoxyphenol hydroxylase-like FAD-dependent oxidoreductase [Stackebrandtia endophytica]
MTAPNSAASDTPVTNRNILISGASVAGPVLAHWLRRFGFHPTIVERAPSPRKTGGHAVDLFGPAVEVTDHMGLLPQVQRLRTRTERLALATGSRGRPVDINVAALAGLLSDKHIEIMRDDLSVLLHESTGDTEYLFGDSISRMSQDDDGVSVTFESGPSRRFDLVVGADGLHSNVRSLAFGPESRYARFTGAYLAVYSLPNFLGLADTAHVYNTDGRVVAFYRAPAQDELRAIFLFRTGDPLDYHHRDVRHQKSLLRRHFEDVEWHVPRLLSELDAAESFYFDSITQIDMDAWSSGRVTLVGDAGYSPGPAVGGGTSLAMVGAYLLAGELKAANGDHVAGFAAYEDAVRPQVMNARAFGANAATTLVPRSVAHAWLTVQLSRLVNAAPRSLVRRLTGTRHGPILNTPLPRYE